MNKQRNETSPLARMAVGAVLACSAGLAGAQATPNGVTVYGLMDAGVTYLSNVAGKSVKQVDSGISTTSRIGFRGVEDLGGGLSALFTLESGINVDTGTNRTPFWGRGAFVGLRSASLGTVTLGRQYDFMYTSLPPDSVPFIQGGLASGYQGFGTTKPGPPPAVDIHFGGQLYDNTVKWEHNVGPVSGGLMYGLGSENSKDRMTSAYIKYTDPVLQLGAGWVKDNFTTAVFANEVFAVKGVYRIGAFKLLANYAVGKETVFAGSKARVRPLELAVDYDISALASIGAGYGWARANDRTGKPATLTQPFIGGRYRFSKSTAVYAMAARNHTSDASVIPASVGAPGGATAASSTSSQSALRFGMIVRF